MEFINKNLVNTTTQFSINNGTATLSNIFSRDKTRQYVSDGDDSDLTTTSITISFTETTTVDRIAILECNWKDFTVFYNGATASTFALTTTAATTVSDWSTNSETSMYMACTSVDVTSVTFDILATQSANAEKAVGMIALSTLLLDFERIPSSKNYKPKDVSKQVVHKISDGTNRVNVIGQSKNVKVKFKYMSEAFRDNLKTVYDIRDEYMFCAFPTSTSWDEMFFPCAWKGDFSFFEYSDDAAVSGFGGTIDLVEVPS